MKMCALKFLKDHMLIFTLFIILHNLQRGSASKFPPLDSLVPQVSSTVQKSNVQQLLGRLFDWNAGLVNQFDIEIVQNTDLDTDWFMVKKSSILYPRPVIEIKATSGVTASKAIHTYLRQYTNSHFSWDGNVLSIPSVLPPVRNEISQTSIGRFRYFGNVCTFSYSMVWWKWADWEKFIDWMALNGINLPLSHVGAESVWQRVWRQFGLTQQQIDDYFTGPAFLAWFRMGNLMGWGGPLSQVWHDGQELLQKSIIQRMTGLGMVPVLQGFDGHVPPAIISLYPQANITRRSCWNLSLGAKYSCVPYVEPADPLFKNIAAVYMGELEKTYGFYHAYTADPFNEMPPISMDKGYLQQVGSNILDGMKSTDPKAIWVMQGWMFVGGAGDWDLSAKYLLESVPKGQMLILDLWSENFPIYSRFESYYGQPFVWNFLHNFGGVNLMYGSFALGNEGLDFAITFPNTTIVGTGLTMEGIYQNYALYQFMLDRFWSVDTLNLNKWLGRYATERYSNISSQISIQDLIQAWKILADTVYNVGGIHISDLGYHSKFISPKSAPLLAQHPMLGKFLLRRPHLNSDCTAPFNTTEFLSAEAAFSSAAVQLGYQTMTHNKPFMRDYLDVIGAALDIRNCAIYQNITRAYQRKNATAVRSLGQELVQNLLFLDGLYSDLKEINLDSWLQTAANKGTTPLESQQYKTNLRYQLTLWGQTSPQLLDYASKQWSGMLKDYYVPRWSLFIQFLLKSINNGRPYSQKQFNYAVNTTVETPFCHTY